MVQESGPLAGYDWTDDMYRARFGDEPSILADVDGTAYAITRPTSGNDVLLGSPTQDSVCTLGGFAHRIPAGQTEPVNVPEATNRDVGRTDLIVAHLDMGAYTSPPGPIRLARIPGVDGSEARPALAEGTTGVEHLPLWAITRRQGEAINQATVVDLRRRSGPHLLVPRGESLPTNAPLGTRARRGRGEYVRELNGTPSAPTWLSTGAGRLIGVYEGSFAELSPPGGGATGYRVWGLSPQDLASVAIPDPGVPYRVQFEAYAEMGSEAGNARWDFHGRIGSARLALYATQGVNGLHLGLAWRHVIGGPSSQVFTGASTAFLTAYKVGNGGSNYGGIAAPNRRIAVAVYEA